MIYTYKCDIHGEFELEHSIKDEVEFCPHCEKESNTKTPIVRLITGPGNFILQGSGWGRDNYS